MSTRVSTPAKAANPTPRSNGYARWIVVALVGAGLAGGLAWYIHGHQKLVAAERELSQWHNTLAVHLARELPFPFRDSWRARILRVRAYRRLGEYRAAESELDKALLARAAVALVDEERLLLLACNGRPQRLEKKYATTRDTFVGSREDAIQSLAIGYANILEFEKGLGYANEWIKWRPEDSQGSLLIAKILIPAQNHRAAQTRIEAILKNEPDNTEARSLLIQVLELDRKLDLVLEQQEILMRYPHHKDVAQIGYVTTAVRLGHLDEAEENLQDLVRRRPQFANDSQVTLARARLFTARGMLKEAIPLFQEYLKLYGDDLRVKHEFAMALVKAGRVEESERINAELREYSTSKTFDELMAKVKFEPDNLDVKVELAGQLIVQGESQHAINILSEVFIRDPLHERGYEMFASHLRKIGDDAKLARIEELHQAALEEAKAPDAKAANTEETPK